MSNENNNGFLWFLAGIGLGAVVGVLYAPKSGAETRRQIMDTAGQMPDYLNNQSAAAREQMNKVVERGRDAWQRQKEQFNSALEAGKSAYRDASSGSTQPPEETTQA